MRRYTCAGSAYAVLYAQDDGDRFARVAPDVSIGLPASLEDSGQLLYAYQGMTITRNGYLIAAVNASDDAIHLVARKLSAAGTWAVSSEFTSTTALRAARLLGAPLSPTTTCAGQPCQFFAKGVLAASPYGSYAYVVLVPRLIGAQVALPVGASVSSLTYRDLYTLHTKRTPLPAGLQHGTLAVHGGTFVPYSPTLAPAWGYVVPPVFWRYLTDRRQAPDGWPRDFGLPLTPAVPATVRKGKLGMRRIMVQAFQKAILTYDPRNAAPFRVERANVGADYAAAFPAAVR